MVVTQPEELDAVYGNDLVPQEKQIVRKVLYALRIPKAQVMVAGDEDLVGIGEVDEPVQEIQHFLLRAFVADIPAMDDHIALWEWPQPAVQSVCV